MKIITTFLFLIFKISFDCNAQIQIPETDSIVIFGEIDNPRSYNLIELQKFESVKIKDFIIVDHQGVIKDSLYGLFGIPLKSILKGIKLKYSKPKELNQIIFILVASDGYKVILSWNEIYNTESGDHLYIIKQLKGRSNLNYENRIIFLAQNDMITGKRFLKGLQKIEIRRIE